MTYQIPRRNVRFTDEYMVSKDGDRVTIRRCFEDGQPTETKVFLGGWLTKTYRTKAGLDAWITRNGCTTPDAATLESYVQGATP